MTTTAPAPVTPAARRRGGPPLIAPALAWAGLTVAAAILHPGTRPTALPATTLDVLRAHPVLGPLSGLVLLASAAPLAVWVAAAHHRLHVLGVRVAGPTIGLVGGLLAAGAVALSGLCGWAAASVAPVADAPTVHALTVLAFAAGGPGFALGTALLVGGVAVPVLVLRLVPGGLAAAGLVVSALGVLAVGALLLPAFGPVLPVVRSGGLLWIVVLSVRLPVSRRRVAAAGKPA